MVRNGTNMIFLNDCLAVHNTQTCKTGPIRNACRSQAPFTKIYTYAMAGNRTRINCLEGSYADHYTTDAVLIVLLPKSKVTQQMLPVLCPHTAVLGI